MSHGRVELFTIGHSVLTLEAFVARLRSFEVRGLADVRRYPSSRRHPHFNREPLERSLAIERIGYRWFEALGGRRSWRAEEAQGRDTSRPAGASPNEGLRVGGFRAYADYALTAPFKAAERVAICCAEARWWQCHRRIIADHVVAMGHAVCHIMGEGQAVPHELWRLARPSPEGVVYPSAPPEQPELLGESR